MLKMLFKKVLCVFLAVATAVSVAGCAAGPNTVVATVNGTDIHRWEVDYLYDKSKAYNEDALDVDLDLNTSSEQRQKVRELMLTQLIRDTAIIVKAKELGFDLTAEEKAAIDKEYDEMVERNVQYFIDNDFGGDESARSKAVAMWNKSLADNNMNEAFLRGNMYDNKIHEKFADSLCKDVEVDEQKLKEAYDTLVATDKEKYSEDSELYAQTAIYPNNHVIYTPEGWRRVDVCTLGISQDLMDEIIELRGQMQNIGGMLGAESENSDGQITGEAQTGYQNIFAIDDRITELQTQGKLEITEDAAKMQADVDAGMSFDELYAKYNSDAMFDQYPYNERGILVSKDSSYYTSMLDAVFALENVGDITDVIDIGDGYAVIKLLEIVEPGTKTLDDPEVRDFVTLMLTSPQKTSIVMNYADTIVNEMDVKRYDKKL